MRLAARFGLATPLVFIAMIGCATTKSGNSKHPGVVDRNPNAVIREYPASATRVAWVLTNVMRTDPILEDVELVVDPVSNESRLLPASERSALGMNALKIAARDVNYNITANSKDGKKVGAVVQIKGNESAEVSLLYGVIGDTEMGNALLDKVSTAIDGPLVDPGLSKVGATKPARVPPGMR